MVLLSPDDQLLHSGSGRLAGERGGAFSGRLRAVMCAPQPVSIMCATVHRHLWQQQLQEERWGESKGSAGPGQHGVSTNGGHRSHCQNLRMRKARFLPASLAIRGRVELREEEAG